MAPTVLRNRVVLQTEARKTEKFVQPTINGTPQHQQSSKIDESEYRREIVWANVIFYLILHSCGLYGLYLYLFVSSWKTFLWSHLYATFSALGITAGAHRLWAHRTYKAKLPLRIILMIFQCMALQNDIYIWARDHRVHHKYTDTNADPHNSRRGFFFSHIGWLMVKKHKDVMVKGKTVDMSDVDADPVVRFQRSYYLLLATVLCIVIPTVVPWYFWGENLWMAWWVAAVNRYCLSLNFTWLVNSAAHIWGTKPYDRTIGPTENMYVSIATFGEGWHNYHHVFPWDYKAAELGNYKLNLTTMWLDAFSKIGWAYEMKTVSVDMIKKRVKRTGDGTRKFDNEHCENENLDHHQHEGVWGWGDDNMKVEDIQEAEIYNKLEET